MREKIEAWASSDAGMEAWEARTFAATFWCDPTTGTTVFPDCLDLGGRPYTSLPGNLRRVEGYLAADRCPNLVSIEGPISIEGGLDLQECTALTSIRGRVEAAAVILKGCSSLTSLPSNLETCNLCLEGCRSLQSLPDCLRVRDLLSLRDCSFLERLPDDLVVGGETSPPEGFLVLHGCSELERFYCSDRR